MILPNDVPQYALIKFEVFGAVIIWLKRSGWNASDRLLYACADLDFRAGIF